MKKMKIEHNVNSRGIEVLEINGYNTHSQYNPKKEAETFVKKHYKPNYITILFGYGLGYIVDEFFKQLQFDEIFIVIDPLLNKEISLQEHHEKYIEHFFDGTGIVNLRQILGKVARNSETNIQVVCSPNYDRIFPKELIQLLKNVKEIQNTNYINENTLFLFAKDWQRNIFKNMRYLLKDLSIKVLEKVYDAPIVVASGGPSLIKQIPILKKYRNKVILIASGSTINSLIKYDVFPDYVVSMDGGVPNYKHFEGEYFSKVTLLYILLNHYRIRECFQSGLVFNSALYDDISKYVKEKFDIDLPDLVGGSTVAHYAFSIAKYMATNKSAVALIGQDLAYTNLQTHASGNVFATEASQEFLQKKRAFLVSGYGHKKVWTDDVFLGMQRTFEEMNKFYPAEIPIFNCTEGGVVLEGFDELSFELFCKTYAKNPVYKKQLSYSSVESILTIIEKLKEDLKNYDTLIELCNENLKIVENQDNLFLEESLMRLDEKDQKILELVKKLPIESALAPLMLTINKGFLEKIDESEDEKVQRIMMQSKVFYEQLKKIIKEVKQWHQDLISDIEKENL